MGIEKLTPEEYRRRYPQIREYYRNGRSVGSIAALVGLSRQRVSQLLKRMDYSVSLRRQKKLQARVAQAQAMAQSGSSAEDIMRAMRCKRSWLKKHGVLRMLPKPCRACRKQVGPECRDHMRILNYLRILWHEQPRLRPLLRAAAGGSHPQDILQPQVCPACGVQTRRTWCAAHRRVAQYYSAVTAAMRKYDWVAKAVRKAALREED